MRDRTPLDELEQECFDKYTAIIRSRDWSRGSGQSFKFALTVNGQLFGIDAKPESEAQADWFRSMLAKAIAQIIRNNNEALLKTMISYEKKR